MPSSSTTGGLRAYGASKLFLLGRYVTSTRCSRNQLKSREVQVNWHANSDEGSTPVAWDGQRKVMQMPLRDNVPISVRLASHREAWQRRCMTEKQPQARQGAGAFVALFTIKGAIAGG